MACQTSANENHRPTTTTASTPAAGAEKSAANEHEHSAPHGGTLIELGEEFAHLEMALDPATGKLTAYALDGEAEKPVRIKQQNQIEITIINPAGIVRLAGVANPLTGETAGETSEFTGQSDLLKGRGHLEGVIRSVTIKGRQFKGISFNLPESSKTK